MSVLEDLSRYGPGQTAPVTLAEARAYCARLAARHYENFTVVSWLTPWRLRPAFQAVYAFCRWSDDLGDEVGDRDRSHELLAWWRDALRAMYDGQTRHPVLLALAEVVHAYAIPIEPFDDLISAFEQDQMVRAYDTFEQLLDYCRRSANPVGRLVLYLGRCHDPENTRLSDCTCTALQLANFWQDVARDLALGRIYLPRADRERFGVAEADLQAPSASLAFRELLAFEVRRTRALFEQGWPLVRRVPRELALPVDLFTRGGLAILDRIAAQGFDVLRARPTLSRRHKLALIGRALGDRWLPRRGRQRGPAAATLASVGEP